MPYWYIWLPVLGLIFFLFYLLAWADYLEKETYLCRLVEDDNKRLKAAVERLRVARWRPLWAALAGRSRSRVAP